MVTNKTSNLLRKLFIEINMGIQEGKKVRKSGKGASSPERKCIEVFGHYEENFELHAQRVYIYIPFTRYVIQCNALLCISSFGT